jgi:FkbM family methyltransferase
VRRRFCAGAGAYDAVVDIRLVKLRLKAAVRQGLASRGIEVHRTRRGARRTLPAVLAHYRDLGLAPVTVIDVGVGAGTPELYAGFPEAGLVLVEALEEWRGHLDAIARDRGATVVLAAAGPEAGVIDIAVHRAPACSSILGSRAGDGDQPSRSVPVVRLDDVASEHGLGAPFVIKVDVEGAEIEVLSGALELLRETELVLLEVSLFELVPGTPQLHEVVGWMHDHGFVVADIYNGHNRLLDDSLAQVDIAFVQQDGRFRREHAYATAAQADALYRGWGY